MKLYSYDITSYLSYIGRQNDNEETSLSHIGRSKLDGAPGPGSGRYPRGSGDDPYQHRFDLIDRVREYKKQGKSEIEIAKLCGFKSTTDYRAEYRIVNTERKAGMLNKAKNMIADGKYTLKEITAACGYKNESSLRSALKGRAEAKANAASELVDFLKKEVDEKKYIDVGSGVDSELGVGREKFKTALTKLESMGYHVFNGRIPTINNKEHQITQKVLATPDGVEVDIRDYNNIKTIRDYHMQIDADGTEIYDKYEYPASMDSKRLMIRYGDDIAPDGHKGIERDGMIEIRRGVKDLDLGNSAYAQVRILVDNDKYLKGMAIYSDDMPDGVDVIFNTNKKKGDSVLKPIDTSDPENPFGALLRQKNGQYHYEDENGERKLGLINKTRQEGDWGEWSKELPAQFLAKQSQELIERQLGLSIADKKMEYEEISNYSNPTIRKKLLEKFAESCDKASCDLKAAALPRQKYQVLLPVPSLSDDEVFAPGFKDGETVALVRFPHAGTYEIPIVRVNNKHEWGQRMIGRGALDAVGVNANNAARLSGADNDGDTLLVIPCNNGAGSPHITNTKQLDDLVGFDPKEYKFTSKTVTIDKNGHEVEHYYRDGREFNVMPKKGKQKGMEMGKISNLITDMTLGGATPEELARAVKHSMVVIDAPKHHLDWKASEIDNAIPALKNKYQRKVGLDGEIHGGASTLISRAKSPITVPKRIGEARSNIKGKPWYDPSKPEGALIYFENPNNQWVDRRTGKVHNRTQQVSEMTLVDDANRLSSGTPQEAAYAHYANYMKALANDARKQVAYTKDIAYKTDAKDAYAAEVSYFNNEVKLAKLNKPRERQAQRAANVRLNDAIKRNKELADDHMGEELAEKDKKKIGQQALSQSRLEYGSKRHNVKMTPRLWEAIQAGAIHKTTLAESLDYFDMNEVKSYALPKARPELTPAKKAKIDAMRKANRYTIEEIADDVGLSISTISKYLTE